MKLIEEEVKIWRSAIFQKKIMRIHYKLPLSSEKAFNAILGAWMAEVAVRGGDFRLLSNVEEEAERMARWLTSPSPQWGAFFQGGVGTGKTTLLRAVKDVIDSLRTPKPEQTSLAYYALKLEEAKNIQTREEVEELKRTTLLGIDDVGEEPLEFLDFGNRVTPIIDILSDRYNNQKFTLITTNLGNQAFRKRYGARIADRINEMTVRIPFRGSSFRQKDVE